MRVCVCADNHLEVDRYDRAHDACMDVNCSYMDVWELSIVDILNQLKITTKLYNFNLLLLYLYCDRNCDRCFNSSYIYVYTHTRTDAINLY